MYFLWLTVHYSNKLSLRSNLVLSVSLKGTAVTGGQRKEERLVHEVISWVSVWTGNLCFSTLYPLCPSNTWWYGTLQLSSFTLTHWIQCNCQWWKQWSESIIYCVLVLCRLYLHAVMSSTDKKIISECLNHVCVIPSGLLVRWLAVLLWSKHLQHNWPSFLS